MAIDSAEFRRVLGHFVTGVSVVTAVDPRTTEPHGLTVNALASVSLEPPLVLVCVDRVSETHEVIAAAECFAVNVLAEDQEVLSRRFAMPDRPERFRAVAWRERATGAPVLDVALAWMDCGLWAVYPGGDHTIYVGEVLEADAHEGEPLLFYRGGYGRYVP
jgi:flavin reductase (DIM6/NTAB) family NADH-FMN oxidoreductase RutF